MNIKNADTFTNVSVNFLAKDDKTIRKNIVIDSVLDGNTNKVQLINEFIDNLDISLEEANAFFEQFGLVKKTSVAEQSSSCSGDCNDCTSTACTTFAQPSLIVSTGVNSNNRSDELKNYLRTKFSKYFTIDCDFFSTVLVKRSISELGVLQLKSKNDPKREREILSTCVNVDKENKGDTFKGINVFFSLPFEFFLNNYSSFENIDTLVDYLISIKEVCQYWDTAGKCFGSVKIYDSVLRKPNSLFATLRARKLIASRGCHFTNQMIFSRTKGVNQAIGMVMIFDNKYFTPYD